MLLENSTRAVGPILSCEKDVHIQGWSQLFDWRVMDTILPILGATCTAGIDWDGAIDKEVAIGVTLLSEGYSLAGFQPSCRVFSQEDRLRLNGQDPEVLRELSWCRNIFRADVSNFLDMLATPDKYGFVKFGGNSVARWLAFYELCASYTGRNRKKVRNFRSPTVLSSSERHSLRATL